MIIDPLSRSCAPAALARLFDEPYESSCRRIMAAGGNYRKVSARVMHRVLAPRGIVRVLDLSRRPARLRSWCRGRRGLWVMVVTYRRERQGHCVVLKDGLAYDNGYARFYVSSLRVQCAWQVKK